MRPVVLWSRSGGRNLWTPLWLRLFYFSMCQVSHHEWRNLSLPQPIFSSLRPDPSHDQNPYLHPCCSPMPPPQAVALKPIWLGWRGRWWVLSDAEFLISDCLGDLVVDLGRWCSQLHCNATTIKNIVLG